MEKAELIKKQTEFLNETIEYYSQDVNRRAVQNEHCRYKTNDGRKCAIGRHIPDEKYNLDFEDCGLTTQSVKNAIPDEIKNLGIDFLVKIQILHDKSEFWDSNGLTKLGKIYIERINEYINQN